MPSTVVVVMMVIWAVVIVASVIVEMATCEIISILFVPGAVVAMIMAPFEVHVALQVIVMLAIAVVGFFAFRPLAKKWLIKPTEKIHITKANIGKKVRLTEDSVDGMTGIIINDVEWRAVVSAGCELTKGTMVEIVAFEGNKAVVKKHIEDSLECVAVKQSN